MMLLHDIELTKLVNSTFSLDSHITVTRKFVQSPTNMQTSQLFDFDSNMISFFIDYLVPEYLNNNNLSHRTDLDVKYESRLGELAKQQNNMLKNPSVKREYTSYSLPSDDTNIIVRYNKPDTEKLTNFTSKVSTNINYGKLNITVSYPREDIVNTLIIQGFQQCDTSNNITNQEIFDKFKSQFSIGTTTINYELPEKNSTKIIKNKPIIPEHELPNTDYFKFKVSEISNILATVDLFGDITHDY